MHPETQTKRIGISPGMPPLWPLAGCLFCLGLVGCAFDGVGLGNPFASRPPCTLPPEMSRDELIAHLNRNRTKLQAWRSTDVEIEVRSSDGSAKLSATLAAQKPRKFRLIAKSALGTEADFGSNAQRFWFWLRRSPEKAIFTARHGSLQQARGRLPIPFEPDWLMETLGVVPFEKSRLKLTSSSEDEYRLVSKQASSNGRSVRREIRVGKCRGYIHEQSLYDSSGRLIARAQFAKHRRETSSGVVLPHRIDLAWPQKGTSLTLHIGQVEVNSAIPAKTWRLPHMPGYRVVNLSRR